MPTPINVTLEIKKLVDEQRKAYGWVSIVEDAQGNPLIDADGHVIPIDVLEKAVHEANASNSGAGKGGDLHERRGLFDVVESVVITKAKREAPGSPFAPEGPAGWWAGFHVHDADTWTKIKSGERPELSLRGSGEGVQLLKRESGQAEPKILIRKIDLNEAEWFSTVDRGASGDEKPEHRPRIVLWKRDSSSTKRETETMDPKTLKQMIEMAKSGKDVTKDVELKKAMTPELLEILGKLDPEEQAVVLKAIEGGAPPAKPADEPKPDEPKPENPGPEVPMEKRSDIPESVRAELRKRDEEIAELRKRDEAREDKLLTVEIAKRFDQEMPHLPGKASEWVELIKAARQGKMTAEQAADLEARLIAISKAMKESPLLKVIGADGDPKAGSAMAEALELAKSFQKDNPEMSDPVALAKVWKVRPKLYEQHKEEQAEAKAG